MKFEIEAEEVIEKTVKPSGNTGRVYVPANWVGETVKVCRLNKPDYRNFTISSKLHDREFVGELELLPDTEIVWWYRPDGFRTQNILKTITPSERTDEDYKIIEEINEELKVNLIQYIVDEVDTDFSFFRLEISK